MSTVEYLLNMFTWCSLKLQCCIKITIALPSILVGILNKSKPFVNWSICHVQFKSVLFLQKDEELPVTARSESPPVPAVSNRERDGGERDVISALSAMRKQLQSEQRRVQSQLEKHRDVSIIPTTGYTHNAIPEMFLTSKENKISVVWIILKMLL